VTTTTKHFDAIIIGTGQAGPPLAARFAGAGKTVAIVERHKFGGTCVNTGCTPTKTLVAKRLCDPRRPPGSGIWFRHR
jgi:pyruvate/2-oxoglutarate dehydrogenase complex dihydrolipoamide dehydrogenase (E3) component